MLTVDTYRKGTLISATSVTPHVNSIINESKMANTPIHVHANLMSVSDALINTNLKAGSSEQVIQE